MSFLDKMERKLGRIAIPNLMMILAGCFAAGYVLSRLFPVALEWLCFNPALIAKGQIWRLVTFVLYPNSSNVFMVLVTCLIYVSIAKTLEQVIGRFKVNFFLVSGIIFLDIAGFILYAIAPTNFFIVNLNPYYLYAMLFVLFALMYPDSRFLFMFIIPIKGSLMVLVTVVLYALDILQLLFNGQFEYAYVIITMVAAAAVTLGIFLLLSKYRFKNRNRNVIHFGNFKKKSNRYVDSTAREVKNFRHKCDVCGRTNLTNPELDFRYCTKCEGEHEYCSEHLYTHVHVKMEPTSRL